MPPIQFVPAAGEGHFLVLERGSLIGLAVALPSGLWQASRPTAGGGWARHAALFETRDALTEWLVGEAFMGGHEQP